jgi:hypothetical protein
MHVPAACGGNPPEVEVQQASMESYLLNIEVQASMKSYPPEVEVQQASMESYLLNIEVQASMKSHPVYQSAARFDETLLRFACQGIPLRYARGMNFS